MTSSGDRPDRHAPEPELTRVGWMADANLTYEDWLRQGSTLGLAGRNAAWWVGDWVRYGTARYGSKYTAAARTTGYDRQTLMNMVYVASRFEFSRRREILSWSHHAELAGLAIQEQDRWLDRAAAERFTVRDLREMLSSSKQSARRPGGRGAPADNIAPVPNPLTPVPPPSGSHTLQLMPSPEAPTAGPVVCPECGHRFTAEVLGVSGARGPTLLP